MENGPPPAFRAKKTAGGALPRNRILAQCVRRSTRRAAKKRKQDNQTKGTGFFAAARWAAGKRRIRKGLFLAHRPLSRKNSKMARGRRNGIGDRAARAFFVWVVLLFLRFRGKAIREEQHTMDRSTGYFERVYRNHRPQMEVRATSLRSRRHRRKRHSTAAKSLRNSWIGSADGGITEKSRAQDRRMGRRLYKK